MTKATAMEVFAALDTAGLPVMLCDAVNTVCFFSSTVTDAAVHAVVDSLEWTDVSIQEVSATSYDPYTQYLNTTRHDQLLRHVLGTSVPHDTLDGLTDVTITSAAQYDFVMRGSSAWENSVRLDTDDTLAADSDTRIPSQQAVKGYVDGKFGSLDALLYKGIIDCSTNPDYPAADAGHTYKVSVVGKIGGASGPNVEVGDLLLCCVDSSASGDHATVGSNWNIIQVNIDGAVIGPSSSTDNAITRFDLTTGKIIQDSLVTIDDSGSVNIPSGQSYKINGTALAASDVGAATTSTKLDDFATPDDNTDLNANTTNHGLLLKATAPDAGILNIVGIANGETVYSNKALFDDTNPAMDGTAAPGTSLLSARRDHVHPTDTSRAASDHNHDTVYSRFRGVSSSTPSDPIAGDLWVDTTSGSVVKIYDGTSWISLN